VQVPDRPEGPRPCAHSYQGRVQGLEGEAGEEEMTDREQFTYGQPETMGIDEAITQVKALIDGGNPAARCRVTVSDFDPPQQFVGTAVEVYKELRLLLVHFKTKQINALSLKLDAVAEGVRTRKLPVSAQEIDSLLTEARTLRASLHEPGGTLDAATLSLDAQVDGLISLLKVEQVDALGGGKAAVLANHRLAIAKDETRELPLKDMVQQVREETGYQSIAKVLERIMEENFPDLVKKFYPRVYESIGAYHSPKACAAQLANVVAETLRYGFNKTPTAYRLMMPSLKYLIDHKMPTFFIAPALLEAVQRTDFDGDISWVDMHLPFEHGVFILPKGGLRHPTDGEVSMIVWSRVQPIDYPPPVAGIPTTTVDHVGFVILALCPERCVWYDSTLSVNHRPTLRLHNLFYRQPGDELPRRADKTVPGLDADLSEDDEGFIEKLGVIVFGTLMAMNAKPELVSWHRLLRKIVKKESTREFWQPNIIGLHYKHKVGREIPKMVHGKAVYTTEQHGTHASPRMHWRRGHFRQQAIGKGRMERKTLWIEPVLVAPLVEEEK
jgi:hypothetical protein